MFTFLGWFWCCNLFFVSYQENFIFTWFCQNFFCYVLHFFNYLYMATIFLHSLSAWLNPSHNNKSLWIWAHWRNCSTSEAQASPCTTPVQGQVHIGVVVDGSSVVDVEMSGLHFLEYKDMNSMNCDFGASIHTVLVLFSYLPP